MGRPAAGYRENIALAHHHHHHHQPGRESRLSIVCVTVVPGTRCATPPIISYVHHIQQLTLQVIGGAFHPFRVLRKRPCRKRGRRINRVSSGALCRDACPQSPCSSYCRIVRGGAALYSLFTNLILNCAFLCHLVDEMTSNVVTQLISFYDCLLMKY